MHIQNDSIETHTPLSSPHSPTKSTEKPKSTETKSKRFKPELEVSTLRRSPRAQIQKSNLIAKAPLQLTRSPPVPPIAFRPYDREHIPLSPALSSSLPINTRENKDQRDSRSPSRAASSYHTALSSPRSSPENSSHVTKDTKGDRNVKSIEPTSHVYEIPSSIPWENTPSDGNDDAWPFSPSDSSLLKFKPPIQLSITGSHHEFRVPTQTSSKITLDDTQDESQSNRSAAASNNFRPESKQVSPTHTDDGFRIPPPPNRAASYVDDTQDLTQDEESEHSLPQRKRKRVPTSNEIPESSPLAQSPASSSRDVLSEDDSCILLSQAPPYMRKKTPEVITINSSQSQNQSSPIAGPRPTSASLSPPFNLTSAESSQSIQYPHNWGSSQPSQSPIEPMPDFSLIGPPSQSPLPGINKLSKIPEPLGLTLEYGLPKGRDYEGLPDLDQMEHQQEAELQRWQESRRKPKNK